MKKEYHGKKIHRLLYDASPIPINFWSEDFQFIDCNEQCPKLFGLSSKQEFLDRFFEFSPKHQPCGTPSREKAAALLARALREKFIRLEWMHCKLDGELIPTELTLVRIPLEDDDVVIAGYLQDLRPVKAAERNEREAGEMMRMLLNASPMFIEIWDDQINLIDCNPQAIALFGLSSPDDYVNRYYDLSPKYQPCGTPSKDKAPALVRQAMDEGCVKAEWMHNTLDGQMLPVDVTFVRMKYGNKYLVVGYNHDLRPLKKAMEEKQRVEIAERESQAKSRFLAQMSHEIRTPMNAIIGVSEIQLQNNQIPPEVEEAFLRIRNSSHLLLAIVNNLLDLSKVEADRMEITPRRYEIASLIADIVQLNLVYRGNKRINFNLYANPKLPSMLMGDEFRIKQVLNNILSNALKYTEEGSVSMSFNCDASNEDEVILIVTVTDTGIGMTREQLRLLFEEYSRFNEANEAIVKGTGLGMAITNRLIKMMNGDIAVESEVNSGTHVIVRLPQKLAGRDVIGEEMAENIQNFELPKISMRKISGIDRRLMPHGRVLVVDDVESNLFVAKGLLAPYGLTVETVRGGEAAIQKIKEGNEYDIIFMDHMMPGIDGMEAMRIIRDMGYMRPIVAFTANAFVGQGEMFIKNGFSGFVSKPIDLRLLDACLNRFIGEDRSPRVITSVRNGEQQAQSADTLNNVSIGVVDPFLRDANKAIAALRDIMEKEPLNPGELKLYIIHVHSMKSALANINELDLSRVAAALEQAGRNADMEIIQTETPSFLARLGEVIETLTPEELKEDIDVDEDLKFLRTQMLIIQESCAAYDKRRAKNAIDSFSQKPCSKHTKQLLDKISIHLLRGDFEDAADLAKQAVHP